MSRTGHLVPILLLTAVTVAVWARPVLGDFGGRQLASPGDSASFAYYLSWNAHAFTSGVDPFFTPNLYAPTGLDLGNAISIPSVSLLVVPVTLLFGGTVAFNVANLLAILFCSVAVYLLARELFASTAGAILAGVVANLSPYFAAHGRGHLNLMWVFGLPLIAYLVARAVNGRLRKGWLVPWIAVTVAFTLGASTELYLTETLFSVLLLAVVIVVGSPETRRVLWRLTPTIAAGFVAGTVVGLPVITAALRSGIPGTPANPPGLYSTEFTNIFIPTQLVEVGGDVFEPARINWLAGVSENTAYLPISLLIMVALALRFGRGRAPLAIAVFGALALLASFGPFLMVAGKWTVPLPWAVLIEVPGIDHALPVRFTAFSFISVALLVAYLWRAARPRRWVTLVLTLVTVILLLPNLNADHFPTDVSDPEFVTSGEIRDFVHDGDNVLIMPAGQWGPGMRWISELDFSFVSPTGNGGGAALPPALQEPVGVALYVSDFDFDFDSTLADYLENLDVDVVLVPEEEHRWKAVMDSALPVEGMLHGGVWVYELNSSG